jgi:putative transposase
VQQLCQILEVNRSWYYQCPKAVNRRKARFEELAGEIEQILARKEARGYGYRRVTKTLERAGRKVASKVVLGVMRTKGWLCRRKRKPKGTTKSLAITNGENLLKKLVKQKGLQRPTQAWVGDITLIEYGTKRQRRCYLATLIDGFSRRVVGWQLSLKCDSHLVMAALQKALQSRQPVPGLIHHSDRGSQYTSSDYCTLLTKVEAKISLAGKGKPWENGMAESFNGTLKAEEVGLQEYETYGEVEQNLKEWLEEIYDKARLHSSLGYLPPAEFETTWLADHKN